MAFSRRQTQIKGKHALVDGIPYKMPIDSWESSAIIAAFPCSFNRAAELIPEGYVQPFRLWKNALLIVTVIDYRGTDIGAYIEYSLAIACTRGNHPAPRLLPGLLRRTFGTGQYVVDLPVSSEVSVKGGKGIWGMPKHQANLDFMTGDAWVSSQYDLDGAMVSRLDVKVPARFPIPLKGKAANYCRFRGMIMRSFIHFRGWTGAHVRKPGSARLILGDHPRADAIRRLEHRPDPLFAAYIPDIKGILDDYFDCWFVTSRDRPEQQVGEGLEAIYPLGCSQDWLAPPDRDISFNLNEE